MLHGEKCKKAVLNVKTLKKKMNTITILRNLMLRNYMINEKM